jgi:hypothetical protein
VMTMSAGVGTVAVIACSVACAAMMAPMVPAVWRFVAGRVRGGAVASTWSPSRLAAGAQHGRDAETSNYRNAIR